MVIRQEGDVLRVFEAECFQQVRRVVSGAIIAHEDAGVGMGLSQQRVYLLGKEALPVVYAEEDVDMILGDVLGSGHGFLLIAVQDNSDRVIVLHDGSYFRAWMCCAAAVLQAGPVSALVEDPG